MLEGVVPKDFLDTFEAAVSDKLKLFKIYVLYYDRGGKLNPRSYFESIRSTLFSDEGLVRKALQARRYSTMEKNFLKSLDEKTLALLELEDADIMRMPYLLPKEFKIDIPEEVEEAIAKENDQLARDAWNNTRTNPYPLPGNESDGDAYGSGQTIQDSYFKQVYQYAKIINTLSSNPFETFGDISATSDSNGKIILSMLIDNYKVVLESLNVGDDSDNKSEDGDKSSDSDNKSEDGNEYSDSDVPSLVDSDYDENDDEYDDVDDEYDDVDAFKKISVVF